MSKYIVVLGTMDTKGEEMAYMKERIEKAGHNGFLIDVAPLGSSLYTPDVPNTEVARIAGYKLSELIQSESREKIMQTMGMGASRVLLNMFKEGNIQGVIGLGGNQGTAIASLAMQALPFGFPKYLVSTVASGNIRPYVGYRDIGMVFSVADFLGGLNPVTRSILANAVAAVIGMVERGEGISLEKGQKTAAITALGNTQKAVSRAIEKLKEHGFQVIGFHASGAGGSAMEELIEEGFISGVLDLTPHELAEEVVGEGAYVPVRSGRITAAGKAGIPQVICMGALEYLCFGPRESIPERMRNRKIYMHNPFNANVKITKEEMKEIGTVMAERLNEAKGPAAILVPEKGWSIYGAEDGPLYDPGGNRALVDALRERLKEKVKIEFVDANINEPLFVDRAVEIFIKLSTRA